MYGKLGPRVSFLFIGMLMVMTAACASPLSEKMRQQAKESPSFADVLAKPGSYNGSKVVWGGIIEKTLVYPDRSDIFLTGTALDQSGEPKGPGFAEGLFIVRTSERLDPNTYSPGLGITVAGEIEGQELGSSDDRPYAYPIVVAREIHLWKHAIKWDWGRGPYYWPDQFSPQQYRQQMR